MLWALVLKQSDVEYFRMSEFAQSTGQFAVGWKKNETRRRNLLEKLVGIIKRHVRCWIGACVSQQEYDAADSIYRLREFLQPYPVCGVTCVQMAHQWKDRQYHLDHVPIEYVFEGSVATSDGLSGIRKKAHR
jgi:hypothetical protein